MRLALRLLAASPSTQPRKPLIKFLGKRSKLSSSPSSPTSSPAPPEDPQPHPESPTHALPSSFINYRSKAQNHGPLGGNQKLSGGGGGVGGIGQGAGVAYGAIGGHTGHELGDVKPQRGEVWDRDDLPSRFHRMGWRQEEIEAVEMGGAGSAVGWGGA